MEEEENITIVRAPNPTDLVIFMPSNLRWIHLLSPYCTREDP